MTRRTRLLRNFSVAVALLVAVALVSVVVVVRTAWFANFAKRTIISTAEESTGGRAEIGSFSFDPSKLRVVLTNVALHGNEPSSAHPFVTASRVEVDLRLFTSLLHILQFSRLVIDAPEINIMSLDDGRTNVPSPKQKAASNETVLKTVIDLAVTRFDLKNGTFSVNSAMQHLNLSGQKLRTHLDFNALTRTYQGQISLEPIYVLAGRNTPVAATVILPITLHEDRVDLKDASVTTPTSKLNLSATLEHLREPVVSMNIRGEVSLSDLKNANLLPAVKLGPLGPRALRLDANASISQSMIHVSGIRASMGHSTLEGSGDLKGAQRAGPLRFNMRVDMGELQPLVDISSRPSGTLSLDGYATLDNRNEYEVRAKLASSNVSIQQGERRFTGISVSSDLHLNSHSLELNGLRLSALGGQFDGEGSLVNFSQYQMKGRLRGIDIQAAARSLNRQLPYDGSVSGSLAVQGDLNAADKASLSSNVQLSITPGKHGVPVTGRLTANYDGANAEFVVRNSFVALPQSRLDLNGSLSRRLHFTLTTSNFSELMALSESSSKPQISLAGGTATFTGDVTGKIQSPEIRGHLAVGRLTIKERRFDGLSADVVANKSGASIHNGSLTRGPMQAQMAVSVGLLDWATTPQQPLAADISVRNGDLADMLAIAGRSSAGYSGEVDANALIAGSLGNPQGTATLRISNGTVLDEPFDIAELQAKLSDQAITVPIAFITSKAGRLDFSARLDHQRESYSTGRLSAHIQSASLNLGALHTLQRYWPNTAGKIELRADVAGALAPVNGGKSAETFLLSNVDADLSAREITLRGQSYGDLAATARTSGQTVSYDVRSKFSSSSVRVSGRTQLVPDYPTSADAEMSDFPVEQLLSLSRPDIPATGRLSGTAHVNGSLSRIEGRLDASLVKAVLYDEPIDRLHVQFSFSPESIELKQLDAVSGFGSVELAGRFDHAAGILNAGNVQFQLSGSKIDLKRIRNLQLRRPGLSGAAQFSLNGNGAVVPVQPDSRGFPIQFSKLSANLSAKDIRAPGSQFGDLSLTASTTAGRFQFTLDSNLGGSSIHGQGETQLSGDLPFKAQLAFKNLAYSRLRPLLTRSVDESVEVEALSDGRVSVSGSAMDMNGLRGSLQLTKLQVVNIPAPGRGKSVALTNEGPIEAALDRGVVRIQSAHLVGPQTDIQVAGEATLATQAMNLRVNAQANLAVLQSFDRDLYSSGELGLSATVRGTASAPQVNGKIELKDVSVSHAQFPNSISKANGVVNLEGNGASVQSLTAESGGGKVTVSGFVRFGDGASIGLRLKAFGVRVPLQQGASVVAEGDLRLTGSTQSSLVSGTIQVDKISYSPQSDLGSLLSSSTPPDQQINNHSSLLDGMRLDVRLRTSPSLVVQASGAQNVQAEADLRVRGTASRPAMIGRVLISEGQLTFFGSTYTVNSGTIAFFNPNRIEPVLNIRLQTLARGVEVVLNVTGPVDNMKLSYTSDPPLQFQEIVALLASGKTPTSDPTLLANQPSAPVQNFQQMGESAIVSKALADPISNRLQRVFGVSQFKIDPSFTGGSQLPTAQLTLQQQITTNVTFTYTTALSDPNSTLVRVEWAFNPRWSAVGTRDQNGIVSLSFLYKRQFR